MDKASHFTKQKDQKEISLNFIIISTFRDSL